MKHFVARTCTVVGESAAEAGTERRPSFATEPESRPLESFRGESAYVLLGPPGSGKTTAFKHEADSEGVEPITARDFRKLGPSPEWDGQSLYIDGLDETRAGSDDGRTPFDDIRGRLRDLRHPRFRLSCREADWFGANDRERLKVVAPDGKLRVLRLDPLSDEGIRESLARNLEVDDPEGFVQKARERGIDGLLANPLNLKMLAEAVAGGPWPRTRTETFDLACRKLVAEKNPEHEIASGSAADIEALLDAAGFLCALLLLAGRAGVTLPGTEPDVDHPELGDVPRADRQTLARAVRTKLFTSSSEGRLVPAHRQLAEFLAARRLAGLINGGLPARRVLSLMTGFDGGIVSELRGLAAWLAAHSKLARLDIVERDPLGTVLHGDVRGFSVSERRLMLRAMKGDVSRNPWMANHDGVPERLGSLAGPDLEDDFRRALEDPGRDEAQESWVRLILEAVKAGEPMPILAESLMAIARDESWPSMVRCAGVEAYARTETDAGRRSSTLRALLDDVYGGTVFSRDYGLLGTLLTQLYPGELTEPELAGYLRLLRRPSGTRYDRFWNRVIKDSTPSHKLQLLDALRKPIWQIREEYGRDPAIVTRVADAPFLLFRDLIEHSPEMLSRKRRVFWLDFAAWRGRQRDVQFYRIWLSEHPEVQKEIIEDAASRCRHQNRLRRCMWDATRSLFGAKPLADYGIWCADQALSARNARVANWFAREAAVFVQGNDGEWAGQRDEVARKLSRDARLAHVFEEWLTEIDEQRHANRLAARPPADPTPDDGRFDGNRDLVRSNAKALRGNVCPPNLLHHLAVAFLGGFSDVRGDTPAERLRCLLGPDDDLVSAAYAGLRGAIHRTDLPAWTEVSRLAAEDRTHLLARPFMVGMEVRSLTAESAQFNLGEQRMRLALAIQLALPRFRRVRGLEGPAGWLLRCLERDPATIAEVWVHCVRARLRNGKIWQEDLSHLAREPGFARLARLASVQLLEAFPVRCRTDQLTVLRSLLATAMAHGDRTWLAELIETKLGYKSMNSGQRVHWLTAGFCVRPDAYGGRLESYVSGNTRRIRRLLQTVMSIWGASDEMWEVAFVARLALLIGPYAVASPGVGVLYQITPPIEADQLFRKLLDRLSQNGTPAATKALESLATDDRLANYHTLILDRLHRQRSVRREAAFAHPRLEQVARVIDNGPPASAADLWALTVDMLDQVARRARHGATSDWRQYWNVDRHNRPEGPRPENACRDTLLSDLQRELTPLGVDAAKEGSYANDKRADIRVTFGGFNVPVEIKRSCHRNWWSGIKTQLIAKYTRDPGAEGRGVYLVFWFGEDKACRPVPASGRRPKSPDELRHALLDSLSRSERRKIAVCVIDVSKPVA